MIKHTRKDYWDMLVDRVKNRRKAMKMAREQNVTVFESPDRIYIYVFVLNDMQEDFILLKSFEDLVLLLESIKKAGSKEEFVREYFNKKGEGK